MANFLTDAHRNGAVRYPKALDLSSADLVGMFVDNADDTVLVTDDFIDDVLSAARVPAIASCPSLSAKTFGVVAVGVFDADNLVFTALTGDPVEQFIVFNDTAVESTSDILACWDVTLTPNGGDVTVVFNASGAWKY